MNRIRPASSRGRGPRIARVPCIARPSVGSLYREIRGSAGPRAPPRAAPRGAPWPAWSAHGQTWR